MFWRQWSWNPEDQVLRQLAQTTTDSVATGSEAAQRSASHRTPGGAGKVLGEQLGLLNSACWGFGRHRLERNPVHLAARVEGHFGQHHDVLRRLVANALAAEADQLWNRRD